MAKANQLPAFYIERTGKQYLLHTLLTGATNRQMTIRQDNGRVEVQLTRDAAQRRVQLRTQHELGALRTAQLQISIRTEDGRSMDFPTPLNTAVDAAPGEPDTADVYFSPGTARGCRFVIYTDAVRVRFDGLAKSGPDEEVVKFLLSAAAKPTATYRTYDYVPYQNDNANLTGGEPRRKRRQRKVKLRRKR